MKKEPKKTGGTGFPACAGKAELEITHRNLPHWQLSGSTYFITFRLKSGLLSPDERKIILDAIKHFHGLRYWVTAAAIMDDHVHIILRPLSPEPGAEFPLSKILQSIKGFTAREINKLRITKGHVWLDESYDRIIRDYGEYLEKWQYIRNNPVKAGLCEVPEDYPWLWEPGEYLDEELNC
jgi:putative transposase